MIALCGKKLFGKGLSLISLAFSFYKCFPTSESEWNIANLMLKKFLFQDIFASLNNCLEMEFNIF